MDLKERCGAYATYIEGANLGLGPIFSFPPAACRGYTCIPMKTSDISSISLHTGSLSQYMYFCSLLDAAKFSLLMRLCLCFEATCASHSGLHCSVSTSPFCVCCTFHSANAALSDGYNSLSNARFQVTGCSSGAWSGHPSLAWALMAAPACFAGSLPSLRTYGCNSVLR